MTIFQESERGPALILRQMRVGLWRPSHPSGPGDTAEGGLSSGPRGARQLRAQLPPLRGCTESLEKPGRWLFNNKKNQGRPGGSVVKGATSAHVRISRFVGPVSASGSAPTAQSLELPPSLSLPCSCSLALSLSKISKNLKKRKIIPDTWVLP